MFALVLILLFPVSGWAATLTWQNNGPYTNVYVERAPSATGTFARVATLGGTNQSYNDPVGVVGTCWKVQATQTTAGITLTSGYSNVACLQGQVGAMTALSLVSVTVPDPPPALVAAYNFNAGSGLTATDSAGTNHGTLSGATWTTSGKYGSALSFDGVNDWVTIPDANSLDLTTGLTLAAWVFPMATTGKRDIVIKEGSGVDIYNLYADNGLRRPEMNVFVGGSNRVAQGTATLPVNVWSHVAGTYDSSTVRLFINGVQVASTVVSGPIATSTGVLRIGGNSMWGEFYQGRIDEVKVYNRALTQSEIQAAMAIP